ncbi:MAG: hypothetical protein RL641_640 [Candidatus Parcubacteria bacterium]|jgi:hypothetical protein
MKKNSIESAHPMASASIVYGNDDELSSDYFKDLIKKSMKRRLWIPESGLIIDEVKTLLDSSLVRFCIPDLDSLYEDFMDSTTYKFIESSRKANREILLHALKVIDGEVFDEMMKEQLSKPLEKRVIVPPQTLFFLYLSAKYFKRLSFFSGPLTSHRATLNNSSHNTPLNLFLKRKIELDKKCIVKEIAAFTPAAIRIPELMGERNAYSLVLSN